MFAHDSSPAARVSRRSALKALAAGSAAAISGRWLASSVQAAPADDNDASPPAAADQPVAPGAYRFELGAFECHVLNDGRTGFPRKPFFAPEGTDADVEAELERWFLPKDRVRVGFNTLLVRTGRETVLVDTGYGSGGKPASGYTVAQLAAIGVRPEDVTTVYFTHLHGDHYAGAIEDGRPVFPRARHVTGDREIAFWQARTPDFSRTAAPAEMRDGMIAGARQALDVLKPAALAAGGALVDGMTSVALPGHTGGHAGLRIVSEGQELLVTGDVAHHPVLMFAHPEWTVAFDADPVQAVETRRTLFAEAAARRTRLLVYHMPFPAIGHVRRAGEGYDWVPEMWTV